ncbi:MAG: glycosyltransferase family 61 protein, partial [Flavobacterium sp.]
VLIYNGKVLLESAIFQREYVDKLLANHILFFSLHKKPKAAISNAIPLLDKLSNNYYHWTTESLTRLAAFSEYSGKNYHDYNIIIAADAPAFVRESLTDLFKVKAEKIIPWKNNQSGSIEKCILISYPFIRTEQTVMTNIYNSQLYKLLNTIALKNIKAISDEPEYLVISRKNANQRKLAGEETILPAFPYIPFRIIYTEDMSYIDQVRAFRNAKIIIAPHGAGLVNLVYVTKKTVVIEIFPATRNIRDAGIFHQIARELQIDYHLLIKEPVNNEQD